MSSGESLGHARVRFGFKTKKPVSSSRLSKKRKRAGSAQSEEHDSSDMIYFMETYLKQNSHTLWNLLQTSQVWKEFEANMSYMSKDIEALKAENKEYQQKLAIADGRLTRSEKQIKRLNDKIVDLSTRQMRDNLIFKGIPEKKGEKSDDLKEFVSCFAKQRIDEGSLRNSEENMKKVHIERIHRMGKFRPNGTRKVIAKLNPEGKEIMMQHLPKMDRRKSNILVSQQFPPEVHAKREKLWSSFVKAKEEGKDPRWNIDQLHIGNSTLKPQVDSVRDINKVCSDEAILLKPKHAPVATISNSHFQGHAVDIRDVDDVIPALQALCMDTRVAGATHIMYAYRVGSSGSSMENWEDDGEWGGGRKIMEAIHEADVYGKLICVTRWYGGQNIGPARFDAISTQAKAALSLRTRGRFTSGEWDNDCF